MRVLYERCCGLDVHKQTVVACVLITLGDGQIHKQVRTFATTTAGLLALADWLASLQISHLAMESTGIYTPPPILPIRGGSIKRGWKGHRTDAEDNTDVLLIHFNPFDQRPNDIPAHLKIGVLEPIFDFGREGFQASQNQTQLFLRPLTLL